MALKILIIVDVQHLYGPTGIQELAVLKYSSNQAPMLVSYTKSGLKWIWYENMVKPTLIKMYA